MCTDMKIVNQLIKDKKKTKYELGNFCKQYGINTLALSKRNKIKEKSTPNKYYKKILGHNDECVYNILVLATCFIKNLSS